MIGAATGAAGESGVPIEGATTPGEFPTGNSTGPDAFVMPTGALDNVSTATVVDGLPVGHQEGLLMASTTGKAPGLGEMLAMLESTRAADGGLEGVNARSPLRLVRGPIVGAGMDGGVLAGFETLTFAFFFLSPLFFDAGILPV